MLRELSDPRSTIVRTIHEAIRVMIPSESSDASGSNYVSDWRSHSPLQEQQKFLWTKLMEDYPGVIATPKATL